MNVLHTVQFYYPSIGGMQEVVKQVSERLVKLGHNVTVATCRLEERKNNNLNGVQITEFDINGNLANGLRGEIEEYKNFLLNSNFDVITNFAAIQYMTDVMLTVLDKVKAKKVFVPTGFSTFYEPVYKEYFENMKIWMKKYDMNVFLSDNYRDINFAREHGIKNTILIPNGAGEDEFLKANYMDIRKKLGILETDFLILNVGSHTGFKGHSEAIEIFTRAKIKNSTFLIIGNDFSRGCAESCKKNETILNFSGNYRSNKKKLIITSLTREETVAAYHYADLFLFPSNIECSPIVLFEAMASKTPFLTTDVGNSLEIIEWSQGGLLLPTIKNINFDGSFKGRLKRKIKKIFERCKFINVVSKDMGMGLSQAKIKESVNLLEYLYNNPLERKKLSEAGHKVWLQRFTWEGITKEYEKLYKTLLKDYD